jgi:predicted ArsR family transcriptional regulator
MPEVRQPGLHLVEHNCPIQQVAERFPEVCEAEARFLAEVLDAEVTRGSHIVNGCGTCEYHVSPPAPVALASRHRAEEAE